MASWCESCGVQLHDGVTYEAHALTMMHQFRQTPAAASSAVVLPRSNAGYALMLRMGWREGEGLGVAGQGDVEPIATALKLNKKGLGREKLKRRVTHFPPEDDAVDTALRRARVSVCACLCQWHLERGSVSVSLHTCLRPCIPVCVHPCLPSCL
jgi:hypothetical protein